MFYQRWNQTFLQSATSIFFFNSLHISRIYFRNNCYLVWNLDKDCLNRIVQIYYKMYFMVRFYLLWHSREKFRNKCRWTLEVWYSHLRLTYLDKCYLFLGGRVVSLFLSLTSINIKKALMKFEQLKKENRRGATAEEPWHTHFLR